MSNLSSALHNLETTVLSFFGHLPADAQASISDALKHTQSVASASVVVASTAVDPIWADLETAIEAAITTAEIALLGPQVGGIAAGLTKAALEAVSAKAKATVDAKLAAAAAARGAA